MYICAVLFLVIGLGSLAVAVIPGADEWFAEQILDRSGVPEGTIGQDAAVNAIVDSEGIQLTAWIFVITFLPMAALFVWIGRWFKSMEGGMNSMFGSTAPMAANSAAFFPQPGGTVAPGAPVAHTSPMPTEQAPVPEFGDPSLEPPDPSAGGFIR
jgi:hypothetical protein